MERLRILAIDDNEDTLELIRITLEDTYDVLTLVEPMKTPALLDIFEPDLVILDVMMPRISGFQLIEYMKKSPKYSDIPVVFLTAKNTAKDQRHGYTLGADLYLTKPFQPSRLEKNIEVRLSKDARRRSKTNSMEEVELRLSLDSTYQTSVNPGARCEIGGLNRKKTAPLPGAAVQAVADESRGPWLG